MPASTNKSVSSPWSWTFSKKNQDSPAEQKRLLVESGHPQLSIVRQCELLGLARPSYYYEPVPESEENLLLMRLLDEQYTRTPFYGKRKLVVYLAEQGYPVDRKRVRRLMQQMGLSTIYPKPRDAASLESRARSIRTCYEE